MSQTFQPGDFLVFQLEAGFALLRVLSVDDSSDELVWHIAAYDDFYLDVEMAEAAINVETPCSSIPHIALTNRAFESTQVAKITNKPLTIPEIEPLLNWKNSSNGEISDRSVRLMLGLR
ncbi:MAG: hypothetical protein KA956_13395 [Pyrinomonadaceae bacterium]|nr:hypothetical protein [Acidobacteriota bacterium]MBP7377463.1 hypothetical protein [Pyrinomonadaceae bacterium]